MSPPTRPKPFPWRSLERISRREVGALAEIRRWARAHADLPRFTSVLSELLGTKVEVIVQRAQDVTVAQGLADGAGVLVARTDRPELDRAMLVEVELALVTAAVMRVAQRKPPSLHGSGAPASPAAAGALAAVLATALRRAHHGVALRVLAAGPATALEKDLVRVGQEHLALTLTVLLADEAYNARVVVARSAAVSAPIVPWSKAALTSLGATPLSLPIIACALSLTAAEVASIQAGDALLLAGWPLSPAVGGGLCGPVRLAAPSSSTGVLAELGEDGRLVLGGDVVSLDAAEAEMSDAVVPEGLIEAIGEIPVLLRVELGEARMAAREWAALGRGDVVVLDKRLGEPVLLRVGGVPVARGDLVEVEGQVGVRIVERLTDDGARR